MNEEKDRFGDFIRLLERAKEDVYFAEKDRELIEKLKRRLEQAQKSQMENSTLRCPRCDISLSNSTLMDVSVNLCSKCGGVWVDRDALTELLNKKIGPEATHSWSKHSLRYVWPEKNRQLSGESEEADRQTSNPAV
jgi:Zn-finger nucleic acid-binding protein